MSDRGSNRLAQPGASMGAQVALLAAIAAFVWLFVAIYLAAQWGHRLAGLPVSHRGFALTVRGVLLTHTVSWPTASTVVLVALLVAPVLLTLAVVLWWRRVRRGASRVDWTARVMGQGKEIEGIREHTAKKTAHRLGTVAAVPGLALGATVTTRELLYAGWEDGIVIFAGPRVGKSTCYAIPYVCSAPGAVLVTSNKRDLVDATRDLRAALGKVWIFDPQGVAGELPTWYWEPLSYVVDDVKARELAGHFAAASRANGAKVDAFFEPTAQALLANMLLAAALAKRPITDVYTWANAVTNTESAEILEDHDYPEAAAQVRGVVASADKQRSGVYGSMVKMIDCVSIRAIKPWIVAQPYDDRPKLDVDELVRTGGTIYVLSREGAGSAGALVVALTNALTDAAEKLATGQGGGRLAQPMIVVLDEAANVCPWANLPKLYSHYGSRGIILVTILQSWSQGVGVWGKEGMLALSSAATVSIYAGGVKETDYLRDLSELIGTYDQLARSTSTRAGTGLWASESINTQLQDKRIFEVSDLSALPKGRAIVLSSGNRATIVNTLPWMSGSHADAIKASILTHDPQARETIQEAEHELVVVQSDLASYDRGREQATR